MALEDHYAVLGVRRGASLPEIRKAYRHLVLQFHPDRNPGNAEAEAQFRRVTAAYEVIGDPELRVRYDETLRAFEDVAVQTSAEAERRRREAAELRRRSAAARGAAPGTPMDRARRSLIPRLESNELKGDDVGNGIALGAAAWCFLATSVLRPEDGVAPGTAALSSMAPLLGGWAGLRIGRPIGRVFESIANAVDAAFWVESSCRAIPLAIALAGALLALALGAPMLGMSFSWWSVPGMVGAGAAGAIGSGFGRAFTSVAERTSAKAFGVAVGAVVGAVVGGVLGLLLVSFGSMSVLDNHVFDQMFGAASGATLGGALASVIGSLREL